MLHQSLSLTGVPCRFDGEAMVHTVNFADGKAKSYCNHWIRCKRFLYEKAASFNLFPRVRPPTALAITACNHFQTWLHG